MNKELSWVHCPFCNYKMNISYDTKQAKCEKVFVRCKNKQCKQVFEIKIK